MILYKIRWKVTNEELPTPIIERRVLESSGCDKREVVMAAGDKLDNDIAVEQRMREDGNEESQEGLIAALYGESVFQKRRILKTMI